MEPKARYRHLAQGAFAALWLAAPVHGLTLDFPAPATATARKQEALTSYRLPVGAWVPEGIPTQLIEGALDQAAWRIDAPGLTTLQLMQPLRKQLAREGFRVLFECETAACGGFDFRYGTEVLPEPDMHVDLGDFRYLAATRPGPAGPEHLSLMVSRSAEQGFVQMIRVGTATEPRVTASTKTPFALPMPATAPTGLGAKLETGGALALDDLVFPSGTGALAEGEYASLADLAAYLRGNPEKTVALVGHTDASGALEANVALSRKRAESVRARLIDAFAIPAAQVLAEGVGYLAPRDSNLTDEGRTRNRRVEVMLTSIE